MLREGGGDVAGGGGAKSSVVGGYSMRGELLVGRYPVSYTHLTLPTKA